MNPFLISLIPAIILGVLNGIYWRKQGYRGWHLFYFGIIVFYGLSMMVFKFLK
jgi:hypothetical protein